MASRSLEELLQGLESQQHNFQNIPIQRICFDSRQVRPGDLFVAINGVHCDGSYYINDALAAGAVAVVTEQLGSVTTDRPVITVPDARLALAQLASAYYEHPYRDMQLIGITGTNGKTTSSYLLHAILESAYGPCGLLGTVSYQTGNRSNSATTTTPDPLLLQRMLDEMRSSGLNAAVMEVSSHALDQCRVAAVDFDVVGISNITQDHLDYHQNMEAYQEAKGLLFEQMKPSGFAVLNCDRFEYEYLRSVNKAKCLTYSLSANKLADYQGEITEMTAVGLKMNVKLPSTSLDLKLNLTGHYNAENALLAVAIASACGISSDIIRQGLEKVRGVPGRLEAVASPHDFTVLVDYAHTEDALLNVLLALKQVTTGRLICVFGCGGDRDKAKRPRMGEAVERLANFAILTSDNPRTENPDTILEDVLAGMTGDVANRHVEADREKAIFHAINMAQPDDTILIAGKGHETYQILNDGIVPFDDRLIATKALKQKS